MNGALKLETMWPIILIVLAVLFVAYFADEVADFTNSVSISVSKVFGFGSGFVRGFGSVISGDV